MSTLNAGLSVWRYASVLGWGIGRPDLTSVPCVIYGVQSVPNRALGFHLALEGGALFSAAPIHALRHGADWAESVAIGDRQLWESFGYDISVTEYPYLAEQWLDLLGPDHAPAGVGGRYWCTLQHYGDGYSRSPEQTKAFHLIACEDGTFAAYPNNRLRLHDESMSAGAALIAPRRSTVVHYAEEAR